MMIDDVMKRRSRSFCIWKLWCTLYQGVHHTAWQKVHLTAPKAHLGCTTDAPRIMTNFGEGVFKETIFQSRCTVHRVHIRYFIPANDTPALALTPCHSVCHSVLVSPESSAPHVHGPWRLGEEASSLSATSTRICGRGSLVAMPVTCFHGCLFWRISFLDARS